jgi:hypothetical protein
LNTCRLTLYVLLNENYDQDDAATIRPKAFRQTTFYLVEANKNISKDKLTYGTFSVDTMYCSWVVVNLAFTNNGVRRNVVRRRDRSEREKLGAGHERERVKRTDYIYLDHKSVGRVRSPFHFLTGWSNFCVNILGIYWDRAS